MLAYVLPVAIFNPQLPSWIAATETFWPTKLWLFSIWSYTEVGFPRWLSGKESVYQCSRSRCGFNPWVGKIPWRRKWQPTPVFLPGESHGRRSLACCSPWGRRVGQDWATEHASLGSEAFTLRAVLKTHKTSHVVMVASSQLELKPESSVRN